MRNMATSVFISSVTPACRRRSERSSATTRESMTTHPAAPYTAVTLAPYRAEVPTQASMSR